MSTAKIRSVERPSRTQAYEVSIWSKRGVLIGQRTFERSLHDAVAWANSFNVRAVLSDARA